MQRLGLDSLPRVTEDEALELMCRHLQLAAIYYMNVASDATAVIQEAERIVCRDDARHSGSPQWAGAKAFIDASWRAHEIIRRKGLNMDTKCTATGVYWSAVNDDDEEEFPAGPFKTYTSAANDLSDWCNMRGKYGE